MGRHEDDDGAGGGDSRIGLQLFAGVRTEESALNPAASAALCVASVMVEEELARWDNGEAGRFCLMITSPCPSICMSICNIALHLYNPFFFHPAKTDSVPSLPCSLPPLGRQAYPRWQPPRFRSPTDVFVNVGVEIRGVVRSCRVVDEMEASGEDVAGGSGDGVTGNPKKVVLFWMFPSTAFASEIETKLQQQMVEFCQSAAKSCPKEVVDGQTQPGQAVFVKDRESEKW